MTGKLTGTLLEKNPPEVLLDCHGVGYEVNVPISTFYNLPAVDERVSLLTQFIVREDAQLRYGFATAPERQALRGLINISGVGPVSYTHLDVYKRQHWWRSPSCGTRG